MTIHLPTGRPGRSLALGLTIAGLVLIWWGAVRPLAGWYDAQNDTLAQRQALAIHMARLAGSLPTLRQQQALAPAEAAPVALLEGETDAIAAANLQERLQALAASAGTSIATAEMLPVERQAGEVAESDRAIRLRLTMNAPWPSLMRLLNMIEDGPPLMLVDDLRLECGHLEGGRLEGGRFLLARGAAASLQASLTVTGFRHPTPSANTASQ